MCIAHHFYLDRVIFKIDFILDAIVVFNRSTTIFYLKSLIEENLNLLNLSNWVVDIQHCFRKADSGADLLAKKRFDASLSPKFINSNRNFLHALLVLDCEGATIPHLVR
jgi:hypothetical protein